MEWWKKLKRKQNRMTWLNTIELLQKIEIMVSDKQEHIKNEEYQLWQLENEVRNLKEKLRRIGG